MFKDTLWYFFKIIEIGFVDQKKKKDLGPIINHAAAVVLRETF